MVIGQIQLKTFCLSIRLRPQTADVAFCIEMFENFKGFPQHISYIYLLRFAGLLMISGVPQCLLSVWIQIQKGSCTPDFNTTPTYMQQATKPLSVCTICFLTRLVASRPMWSRPDDETGLFDIWSRSRVTYSWSWISPILENQDKQIFFFSFQLVVGGVLNRLTQLVLILSVQRKI